MQSIFEKQSVSEIPLILSNLLELPEDQVVIPDGVKGPSRGFLVRAGKYDFLVECKGSSSLASLNPAVVRFRDDSRNLGRNVIPLLVVPYMGETGRRFCDERELAWIDLSGNAHIKAPGLLINIEGRPNRFKSAGRPPNLFAPKSSRIARQLLTEPVRGFTQRELSQATGLDEGYTSRIVHRLIESGFVLKDNEGLLMPRDPSNLLDAWHEAYDFKKHHIIKGHIPARSGDELLHRIADVLKNLEIDYAATGLGAAWVYTHFANFRLATFYLPNPPGEELYKGLGFREDEQGANTWLVVPNDEGIFHDLEARDRIRCVHPIQVFLDLKAHPERSSEAASRLRQEYLKWRQDA